MDWKTELASIIQNHSSASKLRFDEPMRKHTYFGIGGTATAYSEIATVQELAAVAELKKRWRIPVAIIGRGSNLLISDARYEGIIIRLIGEFDQIEFDGNRVCAGAGVSLPKLSKTTARRSLSGAEFALGIPGSVGGALIMNAGALGSCFGDLVEKIQVMLDDGGLIDIYRDDAQFSYRHSQLQAYFCTTGVILNLTPGNAETITAHMQELYKQKIESQPFVEENAGCMFKNPSGASAGQLIDECGLKGYRIGGAEVSKIHGNFIINIDCATAQDVLDLVHHIQTHVKKKKGVELQMEVKLLGFDNQ
jgi:UDP-N-acetylmuramate dehydrogenase